MSDAVSNLGATLRFLDVDPTGVDVAELTSITGPSETTEIVDVTNYDSDGVREFIAGLTDPGEVAIEGNFISADVGQTYVKTSFDAKTIRSCRILFADVTYVDFNALITTYEAAPGPVGEQIKFTATLKVTSKPVYA